MNGTYGMYLGTVVPNSTATSTDGGTINAVDLNVQLNDGSSYYHEFDLNYTCGTDGTIVFTGVGKQWDNGGEYISGAIDNNNHSATYTANYIRDDSFVWVVSGAVLDPSSTFGNIDWTGTWGGYTLTGGFHNVPNCAPALVVGNHGQYVSGATHAGIKGKDLAAIAKDSSLIGPYPG